MSTQPQQKHLHPIFHGIAGLVSSVATTLIFYPLEAIKTRFQEVHTGPLSSQFPSYHGFINAIVRITKEERLKGFYRGMSVAMIGSCLSWSCYLWSFEAMKNVKKKWLKTEELSPFWNLLAGAEAGVVMAIVTNPFWVVKTRMQLQLMNPKGDFYSNFVDGLKSTYKAEGVRGLYRGITPAFILVSHGALQFMAYEELKRWYRRWNGGNNLMGVEYFLIGSLSKLFASFVTYPFSLIKTRFQAEQNFFRISYSGIFQTLVKIIRMEGLKGIYRGFFVNALRVVPYSAATLTVYEQLLTLMSYFVPSTKR